MPLSGSQVLTTAMTRYKAQHGKALMFRGMRYLDVMRWQKQVQVPPSSCWRIHLHTATASPASTQKPACVLQCHSMRLVSLRW